MPPKQSAEASGYVPGPEVGNDLPFVPNCHSDMKHACKNLSKEEKDEIVSNARSREDFLDVYKAMNEPYWGYCHCEIRIISGQGCLKHRIKDKDGAEDRTRETGKSHWAWFIDPCARGYMCPFAKKRAIDNDGDPEKLACKILLAEPTNDWVLAQKDMDPIGTVAGRASTDIFLLSECPACLGMNVDKKIIRLLDPQEGKWMK
ncbi:hypothetical protein BU23DRAFT_629838 [Bimuria novae-zelandiae CBS 107.79]|uniref:Uncharacterized protein n=1 Tax=Bimuria novae-zelandiae CBS 107.79 TaxID=1447943 RepID=A0A6A5VSK2_9PLEO|nr:hypothetical protein BU23DRAFT_629838 [Bimuria novae-zelandiae CBS 107.79]